MYGDNAECRFSQQVREKAEPGGARLAARYGNEHEEEGINIPEKRGIKDSLTEPQAATKAVTMASN